MPKQRKSASRSRDKISDNDKAPKQTYFTPRNRIVAKRELATVGPTTRQQTLTQIDFVQRPGQLMDQIDLELEQPQIQSTPPAKKRRISNFNNSTPSARSRAPKRRSLRLQHLPPENIDISIETSKPKFNDAPQGFSNAPEVLMPPPPRTPRKAIERVIPSSQSPAVTPLSLRSPRYVAHPSESPLKELSTNAKTPCGRSRTKTRKGKQTSPMVQDTYNETENSDLSTQAPLSRASSIVSRKEISHHVTDSTDAPSGNCSRSQQLITKSEILNSDDNLEGKADEGDYNRGIQASVDEEASMFGHKGERQGRKGVHTDNTTISSFTALRASSGPDSDSFDKPKTAGDRTRKQGQDPYAVKSLKHEHLSESEANIEEATAPQNEIFSERRGLTSTSNHSLRAARHSQRDGSQRLATKPSLQKKDGAGLYQKDNEEDHMISKIKEEATGLPSSKSVEKNRSVQGEKHSAQSKGKKPRAVNKVLKEANLDPPELDVLDKSTNTQTSSARIESSYITGNAQPEAPRDPLQSLPEFMDLNIPRGKQKALNIPSGSPQKYSPVRNPYSDSQQAAAQLESELQVQTQGFVPVLETESQFQDAFRPFSPPQPVPQSDYDLDKDVPTPVPNSELEAILVESSPPRPNPPHLLSASARVQNVRSQTRPLQAIRANQSQHPKSSGLIPPSQASTASILSSPVLTQGKPKITPKQALLSTQETESSPEPAESPLKDIHRMSPSPTPRRRHPPPKLKPRSRSKSSVIASSTVPISEISERNSKTAVKEQEKEEEDEDAERVAFFRAHGFEPMTDSQMLPDSLMNFQMPQLPSFLFQEGLNEEESEEEE